MSIRANTPRRLLETWRLFKQSANTLAFNEDSVFIGLYWKFYGIAASSQLFI